MKSSKANFSNPVATARALASNRAVPVLSHDGSVRKHLTVSPTASEPQSLNGAGTSTFMTRLSSALEEYAGRGQVFDSTAAVNNVAKISSVLTNFFQDVQDLDPVNSPDPYFMTGMRPESQLDIPVVFDPTIFAHNAAGSRFVEKMSFTTHRMTPREDVNQPWVTQQACTPSLAPATFGTFMRAKIVDKLKQASFTIELAYNTTSASGLVVRDVLYKQSFYLIDNVATLFIPWISKSITADTRLKTITGAEEEDDYTQLVVNTTGGTDYIMAPLTPHFNDSQLDGNATAMNVKGSYSLHLTAADNVIIEGTLIPNAGNPSLSLARCIIEGNEADFFAAILTELK